MYKKNILLERIVGGNMDRFVFKKVEIKKCYIKEDFIIKFNLTTNFYLAD